jgi:AMMECR1 domain-containing protein
MFQPSGGDTQQAVPQWPLELYLSLELHASFHCASGSAGRMAEVVHCLYCFDVLASHLRRTGCPDPPFPTEASFPLFVTWNKQNQNGHLDLRGCIGVTGALWPEAAHHNLTRRVHVCPGCLSPLPITSLKNYALTSALKDRRFSPIDARELPHLHCTVSLLTSFEVACSLDDWTIGPHGVMIDYVDPTNQAPRATEPSTFLVRVSSRAPPRAVGPRAPHRRTRLPPQARSAVYLPDVIPEQGWSKAETVDSLVRKSGYTGQAAA